MPRLMDLTTPPKLAAGASARFRAPASRARRRTRCSLSPAAVPVEVPNASHRWRNRSAHNTQEHVRPRVWERRGANKHDSKPTREHVLGRPLCRVVPKRLVRGSRTNAQQTPADTQRGRRQGGRPARRARTGLFPKIGQTVNPLRDPDRIHELANRFERNSTASDSSLGHAAGSVYADEPGRIKRAGSGDEKEFLDDAKRSGYLKPPCGERISYFSALDRPPATAGGRSW